MRVAVVIPIYNVKDYLRECLDSVIYQTYQNLQIILIDDGSNDGSFDIAKEYFEKDSRITLLSKENGGISSARNLGISYLALGTSFAPPPIYNSYKKKNIQYSLIVLH